MAQCNSKEAIRKNKKEQPAHGAVPLIYYGVIHLQVPYALSQGGDAYDYMDGIINILPCFDRVCLLVPKQVISNEKAAQHVLICEGNVIIAGAVLLCQKTSFYKNGTNVDPCGIINTKST